MDKDTKQQDDLPEVWWKPAVEVFTEVSAWIVVPIVSALAIGKSLDKYFNTKPWIFIFLAVLAFLFSSVKIFKIVKRYGEKLKNQKPNNND